MSVRFSQSSWIGRVTGLMVSKMKQAIESSSFGGSFSMFVLGSSVGISVGIQYWEGFGLGGKLSRVDCDWVLQQLHELLLSELFGGVGRFGRVL